MVLVLVALALEEGLYIVRRSSMVLGHPNSKRVYVLESKFQPIEY